MQDFKTCQDFYWAQFAKNKTNRLYNKPEDLQADASKNLKWRHHNLTYLEFSKQHIGSRYSFTTKVLIGAIGTPIIITALTISVIWNTFAATLSLAKGNTKPIRALPFQLARIFQLTAGAIIQLFHTTYGGYLRQMAAFEIACINIYKRQNSTKEPQSTVQQGHLSNKHFG